MAQPAEAERDAVSLPLTTEDFGIPRHSVYTPSLIAKYFGTSARTIERQIEDGHLRAVLIGSSWKTPLMELREYVIRRNAMMLLNSQQRRWV